MRIMLDTNILVSMILFPNAKIVSILGYITQNHELLLSSYVLDELTDVVRRKKPNLLSAVDTFLSELSYELVRTPENIKQEIVEIRDPKDYPILYTAIVESADIFITGDKDFLDIREGIEIPEIMTLTEFMEKYMRR